MAINFEVNKKIEQVIREIEKDFQRNQGLILTEDDLKCQLYSRLIQIEELSALVQTEDETEVYAIPIHTEVAWYDDNNKLTIKPDLTILEPEHLRILEGRQDGRKLPSKQFGFSGKAIIFELKFVRARTGISLQQFKKEIESDFNKIQRLFRKLDAQGMPNEIYCFFVIFNKTDKKCGEFEKFLHENRESRRHKIIYASANVVFPKQRRKRVAEISLTTT